MTNEVEHIFYIAFVAFSYMLSLYLQITITSVFPTVYNKVKYETGNVNFTCDNICHSRNA